MHIVPRHGIGETLSDPPLPELLTRRPTVESERKSHLCPGRSKDREESGPLSLHIVKKAEEPEVLYGAPQRIIGLYLFIQRPVLGVGKRNGRDLLQPHLAEMSSEGPLHSLRQVTHIEKEPGHIGRGKVGRTIDEQTAP